MPDMALTPPLETMLPLVLTLTAYAGWPVVECECDDGEPLIVIDEVCAVIDGDDSCSVIDGSDDCSVVSGSDSCAVVSGSEVC